MTQIHSQSHITSSSLFRRMDTTRYSKISQKNLNQRNFHEFRQVCRHAATFSVFSLARQSNLSMLHCVLRALIKVNKVNMSTADISLTVFSTAAVDQLIDYSIITYCFRSSLSVSSVEKKIFQISCLTVIFVLFDH